MRKWQIAVAAAAVAALTVALAPTANAGRSDPPLEPPGPWMTCAGGKPVTSGRITDSRILVRDVIYLQMKITIDPCVRPLGRAVFAAVVFPSQARVRPTYTTSYYASLEPGD